MCVNLRGRMRPQVTQGKSLDELRITRKIFGHLLDSIGFQFTHQLVLGYAERMP